MCLDDLATNGKPEARAFLAIGGSGGEPPEVLKKTRAFRLQNARTLVANRTTHHLAVGIIDKDIQPGSDGSARRRVFDGVAQQIINDLVNAGRVDHDGVGGSGRQQPKSCAFVLGLDCRQPHALGHDVGQRSGREIQAEFARLEHGEFQQFGNEIEHSLAGVADGCHDLFLIIAERPEIRIEQEVSQPSN